MSEIRDLRFADSNWDIPWYITRECCITILHHAMESTVANTINATYARRMMVGCYTVECTTAFLYSDWLYFPWHDIKSIRYTSQTH